MSIGGKNLNETRSLGEYAWEIKEKQVGIAKSQDGRKDWP